MIKKIFGLIILILSFSQIGKAQQTVEKPCPLNYDNAVVPLTTVNGSTGGLRYNACYNASNGKMFLQTDDTNVPHDPGSIFAGNNCPNVSSICFLIHQDAKRVTDASTSNGSPNITSATAGFATSDIGKIGFVVYAGGTTTEGTIISVTSPTVAVLSVNATTNGSNETFVWGTDDAPVLQTAWQTALASGLSLRVSPGDILIESFTGIALFEHDLVAFKLGNALIGAGADSTQFWPTPNFPFSRFASGQGIFYYNYNAGGVTPYDEIRGITIDGNNQSLSAQSPNRAAIGGSLFDFNRSQILHWGSVSSPSFVGVTLGAAGIMYQDDIDTVGATACQSNALGTAAINVFCRGGTKSWNIGASAKLELISTNLAGSNQAAQPVIDNAGRLTVLGGVIAPIAGTKAAIDTENGGVTSIIGTDMSPAIATPGIRVETGGLVFATNTKGNNTINNGTLIDGGGNTFGAITGTGATNISGIQSGLVTLAGGTGAFTFSPAFVNAPVCTATDTTAANAVKTSTTNTTLTLTGTTTDIIAFSCFGHPN